MMNLNCEDKNEDRRIRKTKKLLRDALLRLLSKKSIAEITVTELTDAADVHRGTFYHHYKDAFELKAQVDREIEQELSDLLNAPANGSRALILRVRRRRAMSSTLLFARARLSLMTGAPSLSTGKSSAVGSRPR